MNRWEVFDTGAKMNFLANGIFWKVEQRDVERYTNL